MLGVTSQTPFTYLANVKDLNFVRGVGGGNLVKAVFMSVYYIDTSVLLENIPLVKFIKTTSGTRVVYNK